VAHWYLNSQYESNGVIPLPAGLSRTWLQDQGRPADKKRGACEVGKVERGNRRAPSRVGSRWQRELRFVRQEQIHSRAGVWLAATVEREVRVSLFEDEIGIRRRTAGGPGSAEAPAIPGPTGMRLFPRHRTARAHIPPGHLSLGSR